jgi:hypothetical protein
MPWSVMQSIGSKLAKAKLLVPAHPSLYNQLRQKPSMGNRICKTPTVWLKKLRVVLYYIVN